MAKAPIKTAEVFRQLDVILRHVIWLPGAGLNVGHWPPSLTALAEAFIQNDDMTLFKALPCLEKFTHSTEVDMDELGAALEGIDGFIIQVETPKRRWFSDGGERCNWGDTWRQWMYAKNVGQFEDLAGTWAIDMIEQDKIRYPLQYANSED